MKHRIFSFSFIFSLFTTILFAQAGQIDSTFGTDGHVFLPDVQLFNLLDLEDQSAIVLGIEDQVLSSQTNLYRIRYDGSQDLSFGINGQVTFDTSMDFVGLNVAPFDADRFLVYGSNSELDTMSYTGSIFRYFNNGIIDTTFGDAGVVQFPINADLDYAAGLFVLDDDKIVVSYNIWQESIVLRRFLPDGSVDMSFGDSGIAELVYPDEYSDFSAPMIQVNDNSIFLLGSMDEDNMYDGVAALKLHLDGTIDNSFGTSGWVHYSIDNWAGFGFNAFQLLDDGKMHFTGMISDSTGIDVISIVTVQLNTDGSLDNSYGDGGKSVVPFIFGPESHEIGGSLIQPDGKIVIFGSLGFEWPFVCRLNQNGTLDHSFGTNGFSYWVSSNYNIGGHLNGALMKDNSIWGLGYTADDNTDELFGLIIKYKSGLLSSTTTPKPNLIPMEVYPNPIKDEFQVQFELDNGGEVAIDLLTLAGKKVASLGKSWMVAGKHTNNYILPANLASGNYLLTLRQGAQLSSFVVNIE